MKIEDYKEETKN